jgi:hypothetical protein
VGRFLVLVTTFRPAGDGGETRVRHRGGRNRRPDALPFDNLADLMPPIFWIGLGIAGFSALVGLVSGARSRSTGAATGLAIGMFLGAMAAFPLLAIGLSTS